MDGTSAKSGQMPVNGGFSTLRLLLFDMPSYVKTITFSMKHSTPGGTTLSFGFGGEPVIRWNQQFGWTEATFDIPPNRPILFEWEFLQTANPSPGTAWIDRIILK